MESGFKALQLEQHLPYLPFINVLGNCWYPATFWFPCVTGLVNWQAAHLLYSSYHPSKDASGDFREWHIPPAEQQRRQKLHFDPLRFDFLLVPALFWQSDSWCHLWWENITCGDGFPFSRLLSLWLVLGDYSCGLSLRKYFGSICKTLFQTSGFGFWLIPDECIRQTKLKKTPQTA